MPAVRFRLFPTFAVFLLSPWATAGGAAAQEPAGTPKAIPSLDLSALDKTVNPCDDFYRYACGGWMAKNPIPAAKARWGRFDELAERNRLLLRDILEKAADPRPGRSPVDQKIGDAYASCMDEAGIEAQGLAPLQPLLAPIDGMKGKEDLPAVLARLHAQGVPALFRFGARPDLRTSTQYIAGVDQGGTTLPDRDYYLSDEARFAELRKQFLVHVQQIFELLGEPQEKAARDAQTVLGFETALAQASADRVSRRDPKNRDHKMGRAELAALAPHFDWNAYFKATGAPSCDQLNVGWPDFLKGADALLEAKSLDDWKTYLRWQAVHDAAPMLPARFVEAHFAFFEKALTGTKEIRPRWLRCVERTDRHLPEALGRRYAEVAFGKEARERTAAMVQALEAALERDIHDLPWMTEATKKKAHEKLAAIANKIGHPETWRDYSKVEIVRGEALASGRQVAAFERARDLAKIGQKVDPKEWAMSAPTVNASYSPPQNIINFPAGILQPPFFDATIDDAVNFGGIGAVIGHELTHGFDDQGRKFDPQGNLTDWWTPEDAREFEKRAACIADQYSAFTVAGGIHVNGKLTLGENTADHGGVRIALMALRDTLKGTQPAPRDGFSAEQRFFLSFGQIWCQSATPENEQLRAQTDPHSPGRYRVNGTLSNMPEFQQAFGCAAGSPMVRAAACRVW